MKILLENVIDVLKLEQNFAILTHKSPDGDAIGSSLALFKFLDYLGKKVRVICSDFVPKSFRFLNNNCHGEKTKNFVEITTNFQKSQSQRKIIDQKQKKEYSKKEYAKKEYIISLDLADIKLLGSAAEFLDKKSIDLCIDHHPSNTNYAKKTFLDEKASATCEIIFDLAKTFGILNIEIAECIYTGIVTDTGHFSFNNVTYKTHKIASELISIGARNAAINEKIFASKL